MGLGTADALLVGMTNTTPVFTQLDLSYARAELDESGELAPEGYEPGVAHDRHRAYVGECRRRVRYLERYLRGTLPTYSFPKLCRLMHVDAQ